MLARPCFERLSAASCTRWLMMECVAPFVNDLLRVDSVRTRARIFVTTSPAVRFHAIALEAGGGGWRGNPREKEKGLG